MPSERVVWGPPGTGKTEFGTSLAKAWVEGATPPGLIAYLAFTKAAAKAAAVKIFETEDDSRMTEQFPLFRTIHSLAFMGLRKAKPDLRLISTGDMKQFGNVAGMDGTYSVYDWEDLAEVYRKMEDQGRTEWDRSLAAYTLTRITCGSAEELERARLEPSNDASMLLGIENSDCYATFVKQYETFKKADGLIDFTDMLEFGLREMRPLEDVRYVVVDEAQDLCRLHFALIDRLFPNAREIWWIGDDDQSIFKFSGASAELFLSRTKKARYQVQLRQTHRFGKGIVDFSGRIIRRVAERHPKKILGVAGKSGSVTLAGEFVPVPGRVLVLHRHVKGCQAAGDAYIAAGLPFRNERGRDPLGAPARVKAWKALDMLVKGDRVSVTQMEVLADQLIKSYITNEKDEIVWLMPRGAKSKLEEIAKGAMNLKELVAAKILTEEGAGVVSMREYTTLKHSDDLEYYDRVSKKGYDLETVDEAGRPKVPIITTIHGSKGRQAESVIVFSEMTRRCWEDGDSEHRLAYVASTRTETDVTVCEENTMDWAISRYDYPVEGNSNGNGGAGIPGGGPQGEIIRA